MLITIRPGPVLHLWRDGKEIAAVTLTNRDAKSMTGAEPAFLRKAAHLSQTALAKRAGVGKHTVSYWECKPHLDCRGWAVLRMFGALGLDACQIKPHQYARTGGC